MQEYLNRVDAPSVNAPDWAKAAAIRICRAYGIAGTCDPRYIANIIKSEVDRAGGL